MSEREDLHRQGYQFLVERTSNPPYWWFYIACAPGAHPGTTPFGDTLKQTQGWHETEEAALAEALSIAHGLIAE
jgi:hypothetical protein